MLHSVSSCWYSQLCFIFCFCLPLNHTVVPIEDVRLIFQRGMDYCCVYHGHMFLPVFLLLTEPSYFVTGYINCNKEDTTIMLSVTQDDDHQISDVLLSICECDKVDRRLSKVNKDRWYCGFCENEYNIWNSIKLLLCLTRTGGHVIVQCRGEVLHKCQHHSKVLK